MKVLPGGRKFTAWFMIFAFCVLFTFAKMVEGWIGGYQTIADIPALVKELLVWSTAALVVGNVLGDHGKEAAGNVASAMKRK